MTQTALISREEALRQADQLLLSLISSGDEGVFDAASGDVQKIARAGMRARNKIVDKIQRGELCLRIMGRLQRELGNTFGKVGTMTNPESKTAPELPAGCIYGDCSVTIVRYVDQGTFIKQGQHDTFTGKGNGSLLALRRAHERLANDQKDRI